jgi:hypothetical protein
MASMGVEIQVFDGPLVQQRKDAEECARLRQALALLLAELDAEADKSMVADGARHARWWRYRVRQIFGR